MLSKGLVVSIFVLLCTLGAHAEAVQVKFCGNPRNTNRKVLFDLWIRNPEAKREINVGVLNYSQLNTLSVMIDPGMYQFNGHVNNGAQVRASNPVRLNSGDSIVVGLIVFGSAPAEITVDRGSCGN